MHTEQGIGIHSVHRAWHANWHHKITTGGHTPKMLGGDRIWPFSQNLGGWSPSGTIGWIFTTQFFSNPGGGVGQHIWGSDKQTIHNG